MGRPPKKVSLENIQRFQLELELAGQDTDQLMKDKKGRSRACLLCQRRKQKCDHKIPSCTACLKAGVKCVQPAKYGYDCSEMDAQREAGGTGSVDGRRASGSSSKASSVEIKQQHLSPQSQVSSGNGAAHIDTSRLSELASAAGSASQSPALPRNASGKNGVTKPKKRSHKDGKDEYTLFLEKKLKYLEKLVDLKPDSNSYKEKLIKYKKIAHLLDNGEPDQDDITTVLTDLVSKYKTPGFATTPLSHNGMPQQDSQTSKLMSPILPLPSTSKFMPLQQHSHSPAQQDISGMAKTPHSHERALQSLSSDSLESIDYSRCILAKYNLKEFLSYDPAFEFDEQLSRAFLDTYFTRLQFKYPLLDEEEVYSFHNDYINNNVHSYSTNEFHFSCGRMWLVFSVCAHLHKTTGKYQGLPPNRYFSTAIRHLTKCGSNLTFVQQIEILILLILYIIRTDRDSSILYEIIKDVTSICKDKLFLNRWNPNDPFANKKLRLFWCVYLIERMICVAVGKPYTILESEIDLPLFNKDSFYTRETDMTKHEHGVHFINQSLKLRRIESTFVEQLNIISQKQSNGSMSSALPNQKRLTTTERLRLQSQLPQVKKYFQDLEIWRSNCSISHVRNFENETLKLYYYRSVRILLQPYLELLEPQDRLFKECQAAAGQICQLYKIFHQKTVFGHSTPAVHTVFVAGVTLIYCMWLARNWDDERRKKLGDVSKHTRPLVSALLFSTMDDLRACSVCLYVMAQRSKFAIIFRDTFDQLMNATIGNLIERCGPDSSELIYVSQSARGETTPTLITIPDQSADSDENSKELERKGMPPAMKRTFGELQEKAHEGFVEKNEIDIEEQKERKRKQGVLQKTSVPKSLSHLLVKMEDEEKERSDYLSNNSSKPTVSSSIETTDPTPGSSIGGMRTQEQDSERKRSTTEMITPPEQMNPRKEYIVKKPANVTESDWEIFQQQAFLQQHHAQQNLQAYLSSLNSTLDHNSGQPQVSTASGGPSPRIDNGKLNPISSHLHQNHQNHNRQFSSSVTHPSLFSNIENRNVPIESPATNATPAVMASPAGVQSPAGWHHTSSADLFLTRQTAPTANSLQPMSLASDSPSASRPNDNGIIFNNGTHNMINNISTWTNDSVLMLMNNNHYADPLYGNGHALHPSATSGDQKTFVMPNRDNNPGTLNPANWRNSTFTNSAMSSRQQDSQRPQPKQQQLEAMLSVPDEEFWTVNDDYGFLA